MRRGTVAEVVDRMREDLQPEAFYFFGEDGQRAIAPFRALATPIAFLLFAFFLGFAIMLGAELNAAIEEEWPAPATHAKRFRWWLEEKAESLNVSGPAAAAQPAATTADGDATS